MGIEMKPYYRPLSLESCGYLVKKAGDKAKILAGGGYIPDAADTRKGDVLIDLQALHLDQIKFGEGSVKLGGLCNLNMLGVAFPDLPELRNAIQHQAGANVRNTLSLANFLRFAHLGQSSPLLCALVALDAQILPLMEEKLFGLWDYVRENKAIPVIRELILPAAASFAYGQVGRSEMDLPQVYMGIFFKKSGELRVAFGGPSIFVAEGSKESVLEAIAQALPVLRDQWAGAAFRQQALIALMERLVDERQDALAQKEAK
ncbi:MAG: FAD binding domain-containing protein [Anaerolineaceae bacterium]|nr:FAD binding domain-containing protein [Anaerolineaceae bacterium]